MALQGAPALRAQSWDRVLRPLRRPFFAVTCGRCGTHVPVDDDSPALCDEEGCRWIACVSCFPRRDRPLRCPAHVPRAWVHSLDPPGTWVASLTAPCPVPGWAPPWLAWPGRPTAESAASFARLRGALSSTPEVARILVAAAAAGEPFRARQRSLAWGLHAYVLAAAAKEPTTEMVRHFLLDRADRGAVGSTRLAWWFSLTPLCPTPPLAAETRSFVAEVVASVGLRQPVVGREALQALDGCLSAAGTNLGKAASEKARLEAARTIVAVGVLRGGSRFKSAVDAAMASWDGAAVHTPRAILIPVLAEKTDLRRAAVITPLLIPLPCPHAATAVRMVEASRGALPEGPAEFAVVWAAEYARIRGILRTAGVPDVRATRRHVASMVCAVAGSAAAGEVLHHRPGSRATPRYTTNLAAAKSAAGYLAAALPQ